MTAADRTPEPAIEDAPRWIEIDGRRWRTSDPTIPPAFRQELVDELMRARRAVRTVVAAGDDALVAATRRQIHAAKLALGERGEPWWEEPSEAGRLERAKAAVLALAGHRAPGGSICPSDAARAIGGPSWRPMVPIARDAARDLAVAGDVLITQGDQVLDPVGTWSGPIRIRLAVK